MRINVLDKGFVELIEHMGNDDRAVEAARVSFQKDLGDDADRNEKLIKYLIENGHESPFEHIIFTFRIKTPLFVARQWFRHRISSFNEISARYSVLNEEFYVPDKARLQDTVNKQGSIFSQDRELDLRIDEIIAAASDASYKAYYKMLDMGIARELARMVLPVNAYTMFYWTVNLRSLFNFITLRSDEHAQWEIQEYSKAIEKIVKEICPVSYACFKNKK